MESPGTFFLNYIEIKYQETPFLKRIQFCKAANLVKNNLYMLHFNAHRMSSPVFR